MSKFYSAKRGANWNYGGSNWKLSRSKIDLFIECPRCFYIDNKLGTKRPPGFPLTLNIAVDELLKREFDIHRAKEQAHPMMKAYGIDAVPFSHEELDKWRENFEGVQHKHEPTGMTISGAVDDVWKNSKGELMVVDYKATAKSTKPSLEGDLGAQYVRQMEVYQWLLRNNGFEVSDTGYFVYVNGKKDAEAFDGKLEFDVMILPANGDTAWIEPTLEKIKKCLDSDSIPASSKDCDYCEYKKVCQGLEGKIKDKNTLF
ncbi:MAG: PD-(D/E)XK nuclease family protein [Candidatus Paceibacterota bacterium]